MTAANECNEPQPINIYNVYILHNNIAYYHSTCLAILYNNILLLINDSPLPSNTTRPHIVTILYRDDFK